MISMGLRSLLIRPNHDAADPQAASSNSRPTVHCRPTPPSHTTIKVHPGEIEQAAATAIMPIPLVHHEQNPRRANRRRIEQAAATAIMVMVIFDYNSRLYKDISRLSRLYPVVYASVDDVHNSWAVPKHATISILAQGIRPPKATPNRYDDTTGPLRLRSPKPLR